ncbi:MAG TPA: enoyl-CoA hydratase-related protein [Vulgatibacteraceae bacterium]|nr:enoyl-CoA hydratase-related protein [Vulgatibacteraceae bacterium]
MSSPSLEEHDTTVVSTSEPLPGVRLVELNRPDRLNAMSADLLAELHATLDALAADPSCRAVVLTGRGRGFCAGLDLKEHAGRHEDGRGSPQARMELQKHIASLVPKMRALPQPVIAAVNGPSAGGGFALALASDVRIAAASATFNAAFVRIGLSGCDIGVSWLLPRLVGASRAFELLLSGRLVDAAEADRIGLVTRVVPDGQVVDAALEVAASITANSPMGVRMTKEVMWSQLEIASLTAGIELENRTQITTSFTRDHQEAVASFLEGRPPVFGDH